MSDEPLLELDGLTKRFGGLTAVDDLSFAVEADEIVGLIGPNGSGKTTTFDLVTGFLRPDAGTITFEGRDLTNRKPHQVARRGLGRTFQRTKPFGKLTVFENLLVPETPGLSGDEKFARARELIDDLDLDAVTDADAETLSGGQKKLLELARVLMLDPSLLLLDEPSAGVNPALMDDILDHITTLNDRGRTVLIIEHDMSIIDELCDTVVVMSDGRLVASGTFDEIQADTGVRDAYLGT